MPQTPTLRRPGGMPTPEELELLRRKQLEQVKPVLPQVGGGMPRPSAIEAPLPPAGMDVSALPMASAVPTQDIPLPPAPPQGTRLSPAPRLPQAQEWTRGPESITEVRARFAGAQVPGAPPLTPQEKTTPTYRQFNPPPRPAQPRPAPVQPVKPAPEGPRGPIATPPATPGAFDFRRDPLQQTLQEIGKREQRYGLDVNRQLDAENEARIAQRIQGSLIRQGMTPDQAAARLAEYKAAAETGQPVIVPNPEFREGSLANRYVPAGVQIENPYPSPAQLARMRQQGLRPEREMQAIGEQPGRRLKPLRPPGSKLLGQPEPLGPATTGTERQIALQDITQGARYQPGEELYQQDLGTRLAARAKETASFLATQMTGPLGAPGVVARATQTAAGMGGLPGYRTVGEVAGDIGTGLTAGTATMAATFPSLVDIVHRGLTGERAGMIAAPLADYLQRTRQEVEEFGYSPFEQRRQAELSQALSQAEGLGEELAVFAARVYKDPTLAAKYIAENLPQVLPGLAAGRVAYIANRAKGLAAAGEAAVAAAGRIGGAMTAVDAQQSAYDNLKQALMARGISEKDADAQAFRDSLLSFGVGLVAGPLAERTGLEKALFKGRQPGIGGALRAGAEELAGEIGEESFPQVISNIQAGQPATKGLGEIIGATLLATAPSAAGAMLARPQAPAPTPEQPAPTPKQPAFSMPPRSWDGYAARGGVPSPFAFTEEDKQRTKTGFAEGIKRRRNQPGQPAPTTPTGVVETPTGGAGKTPDALQTETPETLKPFTPPTLPPDLAGQTFTPGRPSVRPPAPAAPPPTTATPPVTGPPPIPGAPPVAPPPTVAEPPVAGPPSAPGTPTPNRLRPFTPPARPLPPPQNARITPQGITDEEGVFEETQRQLEGIQDVIPEPRPVPPAPSAPPPPPPTPPTFRSARTFREIPGVEAPSLPEGEEGRVQFPEGIKGAEPIVPNPPLQRKAFVEIGAQIQDSIDEEVARRPEDEDPEKIKVKNVKERPDAAIAEAVFYSPNVPEVLIPRYGGSPTDLAENSLERVWGGIGREMAGIIGKPDLSLRDMTQSQIVTDAHWKRWAEIYGRRAGLLQGEIQGLIDTARGGFEKEGLNTEGAGAFLRRDDVRQAMGAPKKANSSETAKGVYDRVKAQMGRVFGLEAAGLQQFSLTHVPAEGWRIWAKLQGLDNTEKYGVEVYEGKKMTPAMAALERAIYRAQTWSQREDTRREIQRKITPDEKILDIETPISEWYGQKYQPKTKGEGVRAPSLPPAARERRTGGTGAFIRGEAFERQGKESGVTIGRPQGPPVPRRPIGLLPERTEERPVEAAPPTPPVAPEPTPSPTQAPVAPTAPPAAPTETRARKKKKTEGAVPPATTPSQSPGIVPFRKGTQVSQTSLLEALRALKIPQASRDEAMSGKPSYTFDYPVPGSREFKPEETSSRTGRAYDADVANQILKEAYEKQYGKDALNAALERAEAQRQEVADKGLKGDTTYVAMSNGEFVPEQAIEQLRKRAKRDGINIEDFIENYRQARLKVAQEPTVRQFWDDEIAKFERELQKPDISPTFKAVIELNLANARRERDALEESLRTSAPEPTPSQPVAAKPETVESAPAPAAAEAEAPPAAPKKSRSSQDFIRDQLPDNPLPPSAQLNAYVANMSPMAKQRTLKTLLKVRSITNRFTSHADFVERAIAGGSEVITRPDGERRLMLPDRSFFAEADMSKMAFDYGEYLQRQRSEMNVPKQPAATSTTEETEARTADTAPEPTTPQAPPAPSAPKPQGASERVQKMLDRLDGLRKGKADTMRNEYGDEGFRAHFITSKFDAIVEEAEKNGKLTKKCP